MPTLTELAIAEAVIAKYEAVGREQYAELMAVYRKLAHAELLARLGWERYEMANKGHMATQMQLAEANAKLYNLGIKDVIPKPE